jgi:hypothetical protein
VFLQTALASCSVGGDGVRLHAVIRHAIASSRVFKEKERFIGEAVLSLFDIFENWLHLVKRCIERVSSFGKASFRAISKHEMYDQSPH